MTTSKENYIIVDKLEISLKKKVKPHTDTYGVLNKKGANEYETVNKGFNCFSSKNLIR